MQTIDFQLHFQFLFFNCISKCIPDSFPDLFQIYFQIYSKLISRFIPNSIPNSFQIHFQIIFNLYCFLCGNRNTRGESHDPVWRGHCRCFWESLLRDLIFLWDLVLYRWTSGSDFCCSTGSSSHFSSCLTLTSPVVSCCWTLISFVIFWQTVSSSTLKLLVTCEPTNTVSAWDLTSFSSSCWRVSACCLTAMTSVWYL